MPAHYFLIEDLGLFLAHLEARQYSLRQSEPWITYSKTLSKTLVKHYAYRTDSSVNAPVQIQVSYELINNGKPLQALVRQLKELNFRYRQTLPGWKTKKKSPERIRKKRYAALQTFLEEHRELIGCFRYEADNRLTEGNTSYNIQVASTPGEQRICVEFIKAIAEAHAPEGIVRGRRTADIPIQQRNGWIRRYARIQKKRGWSTAEIAHEIQKQLRNGTWDERSRLQYNIANNTICKIAGIKLPNYH